MTAPARHQLVTAHITRILTRITYVSGSSSRPSSSVRSVASYCCRRRPAAPRAHAGPYASPSSSRVASSAHGSLSFPSHLSSPSPYDIFHLPRSSTPAEIKDRYYDLVKVLHPDRRLNYVLSEGASLTFRRGIRESEVRDSRSKAADNDADDENRAKEEFRLVVKAYELLTDHKRRGVYDRYGIGWDLGASSLHNPFGASNGEWAELRRRSAFAQGATGQGPFYGWNGQMGHDYSGWQRQAGSGSAFYANSAGPRKGSDFSFYSHPSPAWGGPQYASNKRFITCVAIISWTLALLQLHSLSHQGPQAVALADQRHFDAVKNLQEARSRARSFEGRERLEALRRRAREERTVRDMASTEETALIGSHPALSDASAPSSLLALENPWGIGHGGPSGREEHDRKMRETERKKSRSGAFNM